jgi:hypothetical protein
LSLGGSKRERKKKSLAAKRTGRRWKERKRRQLACQKISRHCRDAKIRLVLSPSIERRRRRAKREEAGERREKKKERIFSHFPFVYLFLRLCRFLAFSSSVARCLVAARSISTSLTRFLSNV